MGAMKDFDRRIRQGGDDAIAAVNEYTVGVEGWLKSFAALAKHVIPLWIPVSERLPDRNVYVLVFIPAAAEKTYIASLDEGGMWFSSDPTADAYSLGEDGAPTHWMSLPEPPEVK